MELLNTQRKIELKTIDGIKSFNWKEIEKDNYKIENFPSLELSTVIDDHFNVFCDNCINGEGQFLNDALEKKRKNIEFKSCWNCKFTIIISKPSNFEHKSECYQGIKCPFPSAHCDNCPTYDDENENQDFKVIKF